MWLIQQHVGDTSQLVTTHLIITLCILLLSAVNNSLAEEGDVDDPAQHGSNEAEPMNQSPADVKEVSCWLTEQYVTSGPCEPCNDFMMKHSTYCCGETGFRQKVLCEASGREEFKSCAKTKWAIEKNFWTFEGVMFGLGMVSGSFALLRRRKLDWKALERVRKQIANCV